MSKQQTMSKQQPMSKLQPEVKETSFLASEWGFVFFIGLMVVTVVGGLAYLLLTTLRR